jgi:hypothetical protein
MINNLINIFAQSIQWRCVSYEIEKKGILINCHYLWLLHKNFYMPFNKIHIQKCIMMMGVRMNYNVCQIAIDNKNTIWMHRHYSEKDVMEFADNFIKRIRLKYAGQLKIS